jgi:hypothetical protein
MIPALAGPNNGADLRLTLLASISLKGRCTRAT